MHTNAVGAATVAVDITAAVDQAVSRAFRALGLQPMGNAWIINTSNPFNQIKLEKEKTITKNQN